MEILDKFSDAFNVVLGGTERFITRMFGSANERRVRSIGFARDKQGNSSVTPGSTLDRINQLEPNYEKLSDAELRETASKLRRRLADGQTLDDMLPDAFAAVREAGKRYLKMRHYDVQMVGGYILHKGMISEMVTGEGKTLVASLPAFLNGVAGSVHVITVNDYLAQRDMEWMGPLHMGLGLTIGAIQSNTSHEDKRKAYACDITYGTNNEFGFDYLRDNMKNWKEEQVQGPLVYAIIDEIDNILIDEARTPLIISGRAHDDISKYPVADKLARALQRDVHFELKEKEHTCHLTELGIRRAEELAGVESFYTPGNMEWPHLIDNALRAHHLYKRDVNYIVRTGEVIIVDEHTGRMMEGRQWSDGLHQAVEAKEGVKVKEETQTLATVTLQNFFKLYKKLSGMTGTAMTEAAEFVKIYNLDVTSVPTNRPMRRINYHDAIYRTEKEKWHAVMEEAKEVHETGRPVLIGTVSIENSEKLSNMLTRNGIKHAVLNAKYHEREAEIIAQAGRKNGVTIATNMAGRGTDIILGGNPEYLAWDELKLKYESRLDVPKFEWEQVTREIGEREGMAEEGRQVAELGGLHVIGTERHESRRIDLQLRGRAGRQGDKGSSRFFMSLEDDLMRKFGGEWVKEWLAALGMQEGERIESKMVSRQIENSQKKVEERHFEQRKNLLEYDEVMDEQRKRVYTYRQAVLEGADCRSLIVAMIGKKLTRWTEQYLKPNYRWEAIVDWVRDPRNHCEIELEIRDIRGMEPDTLVEYLRATADRQADIQIQEKIEENLPRDVEDDRERNWQAMSMWINRRFGLNTNDRELKKIGLDDIHQELYTRASAAIERFDFSPVEGFLKDDFGHQELSKLVRHHYGLDIPASAFAGKDPEESAALIEVQIAELYRRKEIEFPVTIGLTHFMPEDNRGGGERFNREGLANWAAARFQTAIAPDQFEGRSRADIARALADISSRFFEKGRCISELEDRLGKACSPEATNGRVAPGAPIGQTSPGTVTNPAAAVELVEWANREFDSQFDPEELKSTNRRILESAVRFVYEQKYRPELYQTERNLILDWLDTSWKDHLYAMDHLRSGIGLVGYAQKDPKTEYRREGMASFELMWDRVAAEVTGRIFRIEVAIPESTESVWQITSTEHASPVEDIPDDHPALAGSGMQPGADAQPIDPIRNFGDRVGRNDPCPCGSGKKYKKCCGA